MKRFAFLTLIVTAFTFVSAYAQVTPAQLVQEWQRAKAYTKTYLDAMPDDGYSFKPTPEVRTFGGQMERIRAGFAAGHVGHDPGRRENGAACDVELCAQRL